MASSPATHSILSLFAADPDRLSRLRIEQSGMLFDFAKTHLDAERIASGLAHLTTLDFAAARDRLFGGEAVNVTENRPAEHMAERGEGTADAVARASLLHQRMKALVEAVDAGAFGDIRHILHVGIGGSALGPDLLVDALGREAGRYDVAVVSNVDGAALAQVFTRFDPRHTLLVLASKTFTTSETLLNGTSVIEWMEEAGVEDPYGRIIAVTAVPEAALAWGIDETRILPFSMTVGGRYSLWSSIGLPAALALGWPAFEALLAGAATMDRHFRDAPLDRNAPVIAAIADRFYVEQMACQTRAVFAYDERLRLLPSYLQQLEMESNGKSVTLDGKPLDIASAPITWGGVGTDCQHAVFQLLHQGTVKTPIEFVAVIAPGHDLDEAHHRQLLINCFAQGSALMTGRSSDDPARAYAGDKPSTTILLDALDPATLGALIAFYEHRTFVNAVWLNVNPFDQFGVELGKEMARAIEHNGTQGFDPSTAALAAKAFG